MSKQRKTDTSRKNGELQYQERDGEEDRIWKCGVKGGGHIEQDKVK